MLDRELFNLDGLAERLATAYEKTQKEYVDLLFRGNYTAAADKLVEMDLIDTHRNRVEEL